MTQRFTRLSFLLLTAAFTGCASPGPKVTHSPNDLVVDGRTIAQATTEFYAGTIDLRRGKQNTKTPTVMRLETLPGKNRMNLDVHFRPSKKESAQTLRLELERIGNTEVFAIVDPGKTLQGRVRFSKGDEWKWGAWAIGLTLANGDALAGAMVRDESTADYQLRMESTGPKGQKLETGSGSLRFVTEGDYQSLVKSWKAE